jgi:glycopeptide antibiotics resistance protein
MMAKTSSVTSARVGSAFSTIEYSICVATITGFLAALHFSMMVCGSHRHWAGIICIPFGADEPWNHQPAFHSMNQ